MPLELDDDRDEDDELDDVEDDEDELDDEELDDDELEDEELLDEAADELELWPADPDELSDGLPVGLSVPQPPSAVTPARARPPERMRKNSRRSARPRIFFS